MKIFYIILIFFITTQGILNAEDYAPSDYVVLSEVLSRGIYKIIKKHSPYSGKTARLSYSHGIELSSKAKESVEALLTREGFFITNEKQNADFNFTISIPDIRLIFLRKNNYLDRSIFMNIHIKCIDTSHKVIFATGLEESNIDIFPVDIIRSTDDCKQFSESIQRQFIKKKNDRLRFVTFVLLAGILITFAF